MQLHRDGKLVLFIDMLGFASLQEAHPDDVEALAATLQLSSYGTHAAIEDSPSLLLNRFRAFHRVLETVINDFSDAGITAITFSDSAFVNLPSPDAIGDFATRLMLQAIYADVPVRMGLGAGSFATLRFLSDNATNAQIHSTQFLGTAVVRAYNAENSGTTGMRILVHPSARAYFDKESAAKAIRLQESTPGAVSELNYLHLIGVKGATDSVTARFESCRNHVSAMKKVAPLDKHHYYDNTLKALRRMRDDLTMHST